MIRYDYEITDCALFLGETPYAEPGRNDSSEHPLPSSFASHFGPALTENVNEISRTKDRAYSVNV